MPSALALRPAAIIGDQTSEESGFTVGMHNPEAVLPPVLFTAQAFSGP